MPDVLSAVQATFLSIDSQYALLRVACTTGRQRDDLATQYAAAQKAYQECIGKTLQDDDPQVAQLAAQLKSANAKVARAVAEMGDMSAVIDDITNAVSFGGLLLAMI
jgi:predicted transglutaminase-like cysteine proteinase